MAGIKLPSSKFSSTLFCLLGYLAPGVKRRSEMIGIIRIKNIAVSENNFRWPGRSRGPALQLAQPQPAAAFHSTAETRQTGSVCPAPRV